MENSVLSLEVFFRFLAVLPLVLQIASSQDDFTTFRGLFTRVQDKSLSARAIGLQLNATVDSCASMCVKETAYQCKSFDYDNKQKHCFLYHVNLDDQDVHLLDTESKDHYQTAYRKMFNRIPNHVITHQHRRRESSLSVEECARRCILESYFKCMAFDYIVQDKTCLLTEMTPQKAQGVLEQQGIDFYERKPVGPIGEFINYGSGMMRRLQNAEVYQREIRGISLEHCAQYCLVETTMDCLSFDYTFNDAQSVCHLSKYVAANVYGLIISNRVKSLHYEKIEKYLIYFYPTPYAVLRGNDHKTYSKVTANRCAQICIEEEAFVCRSFDYQILDGTCVLSSSTGSDVGGLYTPNRAAQEIHHFELKPILDCGGNFTQREGDFASPNWPRNYAHNHECTWHIKVSQHKVINLKFTHFDVGRPQQDPCDESQDRLKITEISSNGNRSFCVLPNTKKLITRTNEIVVQFYSNSRVDAQGFRAFYSAEWPCDVLLDKSPGDRSPGEFASPKWPDPYPISSRCSWRITAPEGYRVKLHFTQFELEQHTLGHCTDQYDHVTILDGGTISSSRIGLYCGEQMPFTVRSTGRDLFVQFVSDTEVSKQGFHAMFVFETHDGMIYTSEEVIGDIMPLDQDQLQIIKVGNPEEEELAKGNISHAAESKDPRQSLMGPSKGTHSHYKTTMWAVVTSLLFILVSVLVVLYLVCRYYRNKLRDVGRSEDVDENGIPSEQVPLQEACCNSVNTKQINNELDLAQPSTSGATGYNFSNPNYVGKGTKACNLNMDTDLLEKPFISLEAEKANAANVDLEKCNNR